MSVWVIHIPTPAIGNPVALRSLILRRFTVCCFLCWGTLGPEEVVCEQKDLHCYHNYSVTPSKSLCCDNCHSDPLRPSSSDTRLPVVFRPEWEETDNFLRVLHELTFLWSLWLIKPLVRSMLELIGLELTFLATIQPFWHRRVISSVGVTSSHYGCPPFITGQSSTPRSWPTLFIPQPTY